MFLNDNPDFYEYLYWGKSAVGHICLMFANQYQNIFNFFNFYFYFSCILL